MCAIQLASENYSTSIQRAAITSAPNHMNNQSHVPSNSAPTSSPSPSKKNECRKQLTWHQSVIDALESHEFRRPNSHKNKPSPLSATRQLNIGKDRNTSATIAPSESDVTITKGLVAGRTAIFERRNGGDDTDSSKQQQIDPAELSLKERFALFEKNKGTALIPKAALGMAPSARQIANANASSSGTQQMAQELQNIRDQKIDISLNLLNCKDNAGLNDSKRSILSKVDHKSHCDTKLSVNQSVLEAIEDVKAVKVNLPKTGSIYPSLPDPDSDDVKKATNDTSENESIQPSLLGIRSDDLLETTEAYTETEDDVDLFSSQHGNDDTDDEPDDVR